MTLADQLLKQHLEADCQLAADFGNFARYGAATTEQVDRANAARKALDLSASYEIRLRLFPAS